MRNRFWICSENVDNDETIVLLPPTKKVFFAEMLTIYQTENFSQKFAEIKKIY